GAEPAWRADPDLRRGRCRRRRRGGRHRGAPDEAARPQRPGDGGDAPRAGGRLRRPAFRGEQDRARRRDRERGAARERSGARRGGRTHARRARPRHQPRACAGDARRCRRGTAAQDEVWRMNLPAPREVVLVTGISGSGKSIALHALEDAGFFCVDNLPPELLREFLRVEHERSERRVAIAVDVRSAGSLPHLLPLLQQLRGEGIAIRSVFLDATTDALVRRFSETRRPHPLSKQPAGDHGHRALIDAIELERELLAGLREASTVIDTSQLRPAQLRAWMRSLVNALPGALTLVFESFAFKYGVPLDADFVFDLRPLP